MSWKLLLLYKLHVPLTWRINIKIHGYAVCVHLTLWRELTWWLTKKARNSGRETRLLRLMELCRRTRSPVSPEMMSLVWKLRLDLEKQSPRQQLITQPREPVPWGFWPVWPRSFAVPAGPLVLICASNGRKHVVLQALAIEKAVKAVQAIQKISRQILFM